MTRWMDGKRLLLIAAFCCPGTWAAATAAPAPPSAEQVAGDKKKARKQATKKPTAAQAARTGDTSKPNADDLIAISDDFYNKFANDRTLQFPNKKFERMHRFAVTYDAMSQARFNHRVTRLESQRDIPELIDYVLQGPWLKQVTKMTDDPIYGYSENRALRILIATHVAADFYEIPYPTLFCLLFQESKFDFKTRSQNGALGLGQLTGIAVRQLQINRKLEDEEKRLQVTARHVDRVYRDTAINGALMKMGFKPDFPQIPSFPPTIQASQRIDEVFVREMMKRLGAQGHAYGNDFNLVRRLTNEISRGMLLPEQYAAMHPTYLQIVTESANNLGNTLNIETNVLLSTMLLRYYMDFSWKAGGKRVTLTPEVRTMAAVAAYNQGPASVLRYLEQFKRSFPDRDLSTMDLADFRSSFTTNRVATAMRGKPAQSKEIFEHIWKVKLCSHEGISRSEKP